ncbi:MAG: caspase family protein [Planctomycetales bacterium]|nr:caspase family protein [Planctomycetales bacterium]
MPKTSAELRAVLVGVDHYSGGNSGAESRSLLQLSDLQFASNDVLAMRDALLTHGVPEDSITLYADSDTATKPSYASLVEQLRSIATTDEDTLLFIFCGHGINVGRDSYLCFPETKFAGNLANGNIAVENALSVSELSTLMSRVPAKRKIILTDACRNYSSSTDDYSRTSNLNRYDLSDHLRRMADSGDGSDEMIIISSCLPGQVSLEHSEQEHGLFFTQLLEAFTGRADLEGSGNMDGKLSLYEVFQYSASRTRQDAERIYGARQHPFFEGGFTSECDLVSVNPEKLQELKSRYSTGEFVQRPLGLNEQISIEKYADAIESLGYGDIQRTIELCTEVLELQPKHQEARRLRSVAFIASGDLLGAFDDAKRIGSQMKVRYTGTKSEPIKDATNFTSVVHWMSQGDVLEITKISGKDENYEKGQFALVSSVRKRGQSDWSDLSGWVVTASLKPASVDASIEVLKEYQLESNLPVMNAQQSYEAAPRVQQSRSVVQNAQNGISSYRQTASDINQVVGQTRSLVNGIQSGSPSQIAGALGVETPPAVQTGVQAYRAASSGNVAGVIGAFPALQGAAQPAYRIQGAVQSFGSGNIGGGIRSLLRF